MSFSILFKSHKIKNGKQHHIHSKVNLIKIKIFYVTTIW